MSHLSKFLIVSSNKNNVEDIQRFFRLTLNFAHIYQEKQKIVVRNYYRTKNLTTIDTFESSQQENLAAEILFPDKSRNLQKFPLYVLYDTLNTHQGFFLNGKLYNRYTYFVETLAEKMNATLVYEEMKFNRSEDTDGFQERWQYLNEIISQKYIDIALFHAFGISNGNIEYYATCFLVPLPPKYSIYELILILPLDASCWMMLGITVAVSALVWRIFEGPQAQWDFLFAVYAQFVGKFVKF